jgi:hypothetical protein
MVIKLIDGHKAEAVDKVVDMIFAPFTPGVTDIPDNATITAELAKLNPKGKLSLVASQTSLPHCEK